MNLSKECWFVNLKEGNKDLIRARQDYVNRRFGKKFLSIYDECDFVGYTLNEKKTMVIRVFFNKHNKTEGDLVTESVHYPIKLGFHSPVYTLSSSETDCNL